MLNNRLETELKIPVAGLDSVRDALVREAASLIYPMTLEVNVLLDVDDRRLQTSGSILRLRTYGERHIVTFKGPVAYQGKIKQRPECEVGCDDPERVLELFIHLGFSVTAHYEKYRETWLFSGVEIVLDHTPMGDFVEIEGPPETLDATAKTLGLDPTTAVRGSYLSLWSEYRTSHPGEDLPSDMVFPE